MQRAGVCAREELVPEDLWSGEGAVGGRKAADSRGCKL